MSEALKRLVMSGALTGKVGYEWSTMVEWPEYSVVGALKFMVGALTAVSFSTAGWWTVAAAGLDVKYWLLPSASWITFPSSLQRPSPLLPLLDVLASSSMLDASHVCKLDGGAASSLAALQLGRKEWWTVSFMDGSLLLLNHMECWRYMDEDDDRVRE
ncbi:hypothetical protein LR48_Vigan635s001400 [Vigna angularis]|uniref:Uncharacterized protein n=1 Tax=Phaseolus angularis TaxID=3914 RepID=A0A0L9TG48_PHAAN|nr:hypothetical protein LR48_Vigan635s001400 [Vigna angularis]